MLSYFNNKKQEYASLPVVVETPKEVKKIEPLDILLGEHPELLTKRPDTHEIGRGTVFLYVTTREYLKYIVPLKQLWSERLTNCIIPIIYCKVDFNHKAYIESLGYRIKFGAYAGDPRVDIIYVTDIKISHYEWSSKVLSLIHMGLKNPILPKYQQCGWIIIPEVHSGFEGLNEKAIGEYLWMEK